MERRIITKDELIKHLRELGIEEGDNIYVHSSLKSVGHIDGGPECLVEAFLQILGEDGTLAVPTHTYSFENRVQEPYDPAVTQSEVGLFTETVRKNPLAFRSANASHSSAAIGKRAEELTVNHNLADPLHYDSPLYRLYRMGGKILLLGVGNTSNTSLHLAEWLSGVCYIDIPFSETWSRNTMQYSKDGGLLMVEQVKFPGCSSEFNVMDGFFKYHGVRNFGFIGQARSQLLDMRPMINTTLSLLEKQPLFLLCTHKKCTVCGRRRAYYEQNAMTSR